MVAGTGSSSSPSTTLPWPAPARVHPNIDLFRGAHAGSTKVLATKGSGKTPAVYAGVASVVAFMGPKRRRPRHASSDRSRVCGERRVGGQRLRVRRHHRGEVEHGRPPPLGSHEGHRGGDAGVHSRCLAGSFCCEDLRRPCMGSTEEGNVRMNSSRCRPWRSSGR